MKPEIDYVGNGIMGMVAAIERTPQVVLEAGYVRGIDGKLTRKGTYLYFHPDETGDMIFDAGILLEYSAAKDAAIKKAREAEVPFTEINATVMGQALDVLAAEAGFVQPKANSSEV